MTSTDVFCFTSANKQTVNFPLDRAIVFITTYSMMSTTRRSDLSEQIVSNIRNREWGLMILVRVCVCVCVYELVRVCFGVAFYGKTGPRPHAPTHYNM